MKRDRTEKKENRKAIMSLYYIWEIHVKTLKNISSGSSSQPSFYNYDDDIFEVYFFWEC